MGISDMNMDGFDAESARYDRLNRTQQPEFSPGQGGTGMEDDIFSDSTQLNTANMNDIFGNSGGGDIFNSSNNDLLGNGGGTDIFGNPTGASANSFNGGLQGTNGQQLTDEEKFYNGVKTVSKGTWSFCKDLGISFKDLTPLFASLWGFKVTVAGIGVLVLGIILRVFGVNTGLSIAIGGCLAAAIGVFTWLFALDSAKTCSSKYKDDNNETPSMSTPIEEPTSDFSLDNNTSNWDNLSNYNEEPDEDEDDDEDYPDFDNYDEPDFDAPTILEPAMTKEEALSTFVPIDKGMYTRQYLYDNFVKVLASLEGNFTRKKEYEEDSTEFEYWSDMVVQAAEVTGLKEEEIPDLLELSESLFTIKVTITRVAKLKPELIADELATAYAYNIYDNSEDRAKVFAKAEVVLKTCIITIFTGKSHMISLKDMYSECKDFILDSKNKMPVVLGVNESGKVICADFKKIESIIVAGMPRSGKTWLVQAILTQLCALLSPKELNLYILDPKAGTSDYKRFYLPHVKVFASRYCDSVGNVVNKEYKSIMDTLRDLVNKEAPRRKKLIGDAGCVNINDFKDKYPDVNLPYIIVVIDEMVTLSSMEKEQCKEYMTYLDQIVTQFPNLGIRGMFIPHEVKNQIISKTAYDSIKARISVKGSPEHIESSTGTKPRAFPYRLCNTGDMAVNIDTISASTLFVHGVALSSSNADNMNIFDYLRRIWSKLEPDEVKKSWAEVAEKENRNTDLLQEVSPAGELFTNSNDAGYMSFDDISAESDSSEDDEFNLFG